MATEITSRDQLLSMTFEQLDDLFRSSPSGPIPDGRADGSAIIAPGTPLTPQLAQIVNIFAWIGKEFDAKHGTLTNRILSLGLNAIVAQVYKEASWLDQKECVVLDYSRTSLIAQWVRDEIRLVGPDLYLGRVYWNRDAVIHFSLDFSPS
jgi:hypothetical protein